jgi:uncharacterized membrane protein YgdD (TMEM256/DUF423 family)
MKNYLMIIAGFFAVTAVGLGAIGSHALKNILTIEQLMSFETGIRYQMYHALTLIGIAALKMIFNSKYLVYSSWAFIIGTILFSFSIYLLSTREALNAPWIISLAPLTPFGGISLILGWIFFIIAGFEIKLKHKIVK